MAVPKGKTSKQRKRTRSAANNKLSMPSLSECSQCHELKQSHRVCPHCGAYDGEIKIAIKEDN